MVIKCICIEQQLLKIEFRYKILKEKREREDDDSKNIPAIPEKKLMATVYLLNELIKNDLNTNTQMKERNHENHSEKIIHEKFNEI